MTPGVLTLVALSLLLIAGGLVHWTVVLVTGDAEGTAANYRWRERMAKWVEEGERPSSWPAEVLDRLMTYERERAERMAEYTRAWERRWREAAAGATSASPRALWRVK